MKTFEHDEKLRFKLVWLPESHGDRDCIGMELTLSDYHPCERMKNGEFGCPPNSCNGITCPGIMKMEEKPFNDRYRCFGWTGHYGLEQLKESNRNS